MKGKPPAPPNFTLQSWIFEYCKDGYWDPMEEEPHFVRLLQPVSREDAKMQKRLAEFWFARSYRHKHTNGKAGGVALKPFNGEAAVKMWGLLGDEDNWVTALLIRGRWTIIKPEDEWQFGFGVSDDGSRLEKLDLVLNGEVVAVYPRKF